MIHLHKLPRRFPSMRKRTKVVSRMVFGRHMQTTSVFGSTQHSQQQKKTSGQGVTTTRSGFANAANTERSPDGSPNFTQGEIEELARMLQKAAPKTLESMSTGRTPLLASEDPEAKRAEIRQYFHATYDKTEQLFSLLTTDEAYFIKHEPLRHPPIFYYGHTACFFINKLLLAKTLDERVNAKIEHMCAVGVDEMSWDDLNENHYDWPAVEEVQKYRNQVRQVVDDLIMTLPMDNLINWDSPWWPIIMGIEHENINTETSSAIFRQVPTDMIQPDDKNWRMCTVDHEPPENELLEVAAAAVVYNKNKDNGRVYGWDNEYGAKAAEVPAFSASKYLVSNAEYHEFVEAGGYSDKQWWSEEGWTWVQYTGAQHPKYWRQTEDGSWVQRQLAAETPLPWSWAVVANQLEAKAFCNWKGAQLGKPIRLPSEDEWKVLRKMGEHGDVDQPDWEVAPGNINLEHFASECPVNMFEWGSTGFYDVIGNVWQWTESPIDGMPGFEVHPLYDDFSTPTFDGKHTLFKGGSWISMGANGATADSRYSFRRHFFQHAGIRYVESEMPVDQSMNLYETDKLVLREIDSQYGSATEGVAQLPLPASGQTFAQQCVTQVTELASKLEKPTSRVLDLGCSVGRSTFELARTFDECVGVDNSARFIKAAVRLQDDDIVRYTVPQEGDLNEFHEVSLAELGLSDTARNCTFVQQPDFANLDRTKLGVFDVVLAANILEKLSAPRAFLQHLHNFVQPGGLLVMASTYNWDEELTPQSEWVGGYKDSGSGENVSTRDGLSEALQPQFRQLDMRTELTAVKRNTLRSMSVDISEVTVWERLESTNEN
jgi:5-histidylcysteine sulfoxide synthase/putative 4-mercaptohistidine N1-methyltranferase